nr:NAC domain-containing protein [Tanacetum cinerariifolium]
MSTHTFAKTYNLIAYLEKPTKSEGFEQIIDFLNGSSVKYALTIHPTIHTSCIEQLWMTAKVKKLGDMTHHKDIFATPSLTKKVFANMKRVGIGFSGEVTSLFANMLKKHKPKRKHAKELEVPPTGSQAEQNILLPLPSHDPLPSGRDSPKLKELMDVCTNLSNKVFDLESEVIDVKSTYQARIEKLESRVKRLDEENKVLKELKSVHSKVDSDELVMEMEKSSKQERKIADIDADVKINLEKAQAKAYNLDLDHQENVLSMMNVNEKEPADVEDVLEVVKTAKLITEVVTTTGVDVNAASIQDTLITTVEATKLSVPRKRIGVIIKDPKETTTTTTVTVQLKLDEEVARQLEAELNANVDWNAVIEQVQRREKLTDVVDMYLRLLTTISHAFFILKNAEENGTMEANAEDGIYNELVNLIKLDEFNGGALAIGSMPAVCMFDEPFDDLDFNLRTFYVD